MRRRRCKKCNRLCRPRTLMDIHGQMLCYWCGPPPRWRQQEERAARAAAENQ